MQTLPLGILTSGKLKVSEEKVKYQTKDNNKKFEI
jgi:hypothetical protein